MIHLDPTTHTYADDEGQRYASVTQVLRELGMVKSWSGAAHPDDLKFAGRRGEHVEDILYSLLKGQPWHGQIEDMTNTYGHDLYDTVMERVPALHNFIADHDPELVSCQARLWDQEALVAGTLDLTCKISGEVWLLDVKCTSQPEADWPLQVGAYTAMNPFEVDRIGVLHIKPGTKSGYKIREYPDAVDKWWHVRQARIESLAAYRRAKEKVA